MRYSITFKSDEAPITEFTVVGDSLNAAIAAFAVEVTIHFREVLDQFYQVWERLGYLIKLHQMRENEEPITVREWGFPDPESAFEIILTIQENALMPLHIYVVHGRRPYDNDDTTLEIKAESADHAYVIFRQRMIGDMPDLPDRGDGNPSLYHFNTYGPFAPA
jgi:hypothetical protein